jgi:hypothetical protein
MGLVSKTMDPAHAIDASAFDVAQIVSGCPFQALLKAPVAAAKISDLKL